MILHNNNIVGGTTYSNQNTTLVGDNSNTNILFSAPSDTQLQITSVSTPFSAKLNFFDGLDLHIYKPAAVNADVKNVHANRVLSTISVTEQNRFNLSAGDMVGQTVANDYNWRILYKFDSIYVGGKAIGDFTYADVLLDPASNVPCDFMNNRTGNAIGTFDTDVGATIKGNTLSSTYCAQPAGPPAYIQFTNEFMQ